jgi:hypothetical protein
MFSFKNPFTRVKDRFNTLKENIKNNIATQAMLDLNFSIDLELVPNDIKITAIKAL